MNETPYQLFGVKLLGVSTETLRKAILTLAFALGLVVLRSLLEWVVRAWTRKRPRERGSFWIVRP